MSAIVSHLTDHEPLSGKVRPLAWARRIRPLLALWRTRIQDRQQLMQFDNRDLRDIGVSRWDVQREMQKHFWQD